MHIVYVEYHSYSRGLIKIILFASNVNLPLPLVCHIASHSVLARRGEAGGDVCGPPCGVAERKKKRRFKHCPN